MSEEPNQGGKPRSGGDWDDVGRQFQELGQSLAQAFRSAWENEQNQQRLNELRTGFELMVTEVDQAIKDTVESTQGQKVRAEAEKAIQSAQKAGEKTAQEVKPHLVTAIRSLNDALQKWAERMESESATGQKPEPPDEGSTSAG